MPEQSPSKRSEPVRPLLSTAERQTVGKALREKVSRDSHATWSPPGNRRDPIQTLIDTSRHRIPELMALRYSRMVQSPFAFLQGAAAVMTADLASTPTS